MNELLKSKNLSFIQIQKLRKSMYESFYLVDSKVKESGFIVKITGSTLNIYTIKYAIRDSIFECNCPNSGFCQTTRVYCKHICFVICGIGKIYEENVFLNSRLEDCQIFKIIIRLQMNCFDDPNIICEMLSVRYKIKLKQLQENKEYPSHFLPKNSRNLAEDCPICFLPLKEVICECPTCNNSVHVICIKKWLEYNESCIFCRGESWKEFEIGNIKSKYINISK
jgi:hypothetical protein